MNQALLQNGRDGSRGDHLYFLKGDGSCRNIICFCFNLQVSGAILILDFSREVAECFEVAKCFQAKKHNNFPLRRE